MMTAPQNRKVLTRVLFVVVFCSLLLSGQARGQLRVCATPPVQPCVEKFVDQMPGFPVIIMPQATNPDPTFTGDYYEIAERPFQQQMLSTGTVDSHGNQLMTSVWGYGPVSATNVCINPTDANCFRAPALPILAQYNRHVRVKWVNDLELGGNFVTYPAGVPVDQREHWANPTQECRNGLVQTDCAGTSTLNYAGPVPTVVHLHGTETRSESDGIPEAWYLPASATSGYSSGTYKTQGSDYADNNHPRDTVTNAKGAAVFEYPNFQPAALLAFHDHTLGVTKQNVYMGLVGGYLLIGGPNDCSSATTPTCALPDVAHTIPLVVQRKSFQTDGSLLLQGGEVSGGNITVVNGKSWPYVNVEPRKYRVLVANLSADSPMDLSFSRSDTPAQPTGCHNSATFPDFLQIGADQGLLPCPVVALGIEVGKSSNIHLSVAERADLIIDFTGNGGKTFTFGNAVQFRVCQGAVNSSGSCTSNSVTAENTVIPSSLPTPPAVIENLPAQKVAIFDDHTLGIVVGSGSTSSAVAQEWDAPITEKVTCTGCATGTPAGQTWEIWSFSDDDHPIHLHSARFQVVNRENPATGQVFNCSGTAVNSQGNTVSCSSQQLSAETGFKDTVSATAKWITRVRARFDHTGLFAWHCHIATHEDLQMMRPYCVSANPSTDPSCNRP